MKVRRMGTTLFLPVVLDLLPKGHGARNVEQSGSVASYSLPVELSNWKEAVMGDEASVQCVGPWKVLQGENGSVKEDDGRAEPPVGTQEVRGEQVTLDGRQLQDYLERLELPQRVDWVAGECPSTLSCTLSVVDSEGQTSEVCRMSMEAGEVSTSGVCDWQIGECEPWSADLKARTRAARIWPRMFKVLHISLRSKSKVPTVFCTWGFANETKAKKKPSKFADVAVFMISMGTEYDVVCCWSPQETKEGKLYGDCKVWIPKENLLNWRSSDTRWRSMRGDCDLIVKDPYPLLAPSDLQGKWAELDEVKEEHCQKKLTKGNKKNKEQCKRTTMMADSLSDLVSFFETADD